jgi:hypothetical protein
MNVNLNAAFHFSDKTKPMIALFRINNKSTAIYAIGTKTIIITNWQTRMLRG